MEFSVEKTVQVLERTPAVLENMLSGLSPDWLMASEGPETFSPYDVVGHLVHGEKTDWMVRLEIILSDSADKTFTPYDRFAQYTESKGKTMDDLLNEFASRRFQNLKKLKAKNLQPADFKKTGNHPALGEVNLENLLATWAVHDLSHLAQIARVMAKQYAENTGKWLEYLPILSR